MLRFCICIYVRCHPQIVCSTCYQWQLIILAFWLPMCVYDNYILHNHLEYVDNNKFCVMTTPKHSMRVSCVLVSWECHESIPTHVFVFPKCKMNVGGRIMNEEDRYKERSWIVDTWMDQVDELCGQMNVGQQVFRTCSCSVIASSMKTMKRW